MLARDELGEWPKGTMAGFGADPEDDDDADDEGGNYTADGRILTNIVMMGMGEPLYNFDEVKGALKIVMDGAGLALSRRRITLSTRSEEHTSELQSLMRISYAIFCLKKKNNKTNQAHTSQ